MVKKIFLLLLVAGLAASLYYYRFPGDKIPKAGNIFAPAVQNGGEKVDVPDYPAVSVIAEGLDTPWAIAFIPQGLLITERKGTVRFVDGSGELGSGAVATIAVKEIGEGGLLGIAAHPQFSSNKFVYLYYTYSEDGGNTLNRVSRFVYENNKLGGESVIVDGIPGAANHDGGRIKFGSDGFLYITTGDAQIPSQAQDKNSLAGKILRVDENGNSASGNPFGNASYSYGHRNPQGIAWDKNGILWATEHGPSGTETGNDELNRIEIGKNYGWPDIRGRQTKAGMVTPVLESGAGNTWAPAGMAYLDGYLYFAGLRGQALYRISVDNPGQFDTFFKNEFGRLREVVAGPDNMLYVTTSNRDGRGVVKSGDDKILRINPQKL